MCVSLGFERRRESGENYSGDGFRMEGGGRVILRWEKLVRWRFRRPWFFNITVAPMRENWL